MIPLQRRFALLIPRHEKRIIRFQCNIFVRDGHAQRKMDRSITRLIKTDTRQKFLRAVNFYRWSMI